jgi:hypothetical protein
MNSVLWLAGQFAIVAAGGAVIIALVVAAWYVVSFAVLAGISRLFPLTGSRRREEPTTKES